MGAAGGRDAVTASCNTPAAPCFGGGMDDRTEERLVALFRDAEEDGQYVSVASLAQFCAFFRERGGPERVTLTPDGTLKAHWEISAIEFLGGECDG